MWGRAGPVDGDGGSSDGLSLQPPRQLHHTLIRVLPASRSPVVQEGLQFRELVLLPFPLRLRTRLAISLGRLVVARGMQRCRSI